MLDATVPALTAAVDIAAQSSAPSSDRASKASIEGMIQQVSEQVNQLQENFHLAAQCDKTEIDSHVQSLLHAMIQRSETDKKEMIDLSNQFETLQRERCEVMEKHFLYKGIIKQIQEYFMTPYLHFLLIV